MKLLAAFVVLFLVDCATCPPGTIKTPPGAVGIDTACYCPCGYDFSTKECNYRGDIMVSQSGTPCVLPDGGI
jgi:hypothetical protein